MTGRCSICRHKDSGRIDLMLARRVPLRVIGDKFDVTASALCRHRQRHLTPEIKAALAIGVPKTELDLERLRRDESENLLQSLIYHRSRLWALVDQAEDDGDLRAASSLHKRVIEIWTLEAKFLNELTDGDIRITQNILVLPGYIQARTVILQALRPFPDASRAVSGALREIEIEPTALAPPIPNGNEDAARA